jgi:hypothetical protein
LNEFHFTGTVHLLQNSECTQDDDDLVKFAECRVVSLSVTRKEGTDVLDISGVGFNRRKHHQECHHESRETDALVLRKQNHKRDFEVHNLQFVLLIEKIRKNCLFTDPSDLFCIDLNGCTKNDKSVRHIIKTSSLDLELLMNLGDRLNALWAIPKIGNQTLHENFKRDCAALRGTG